MLRHVLRRATAFRATRVPRASYHPASLSARVRTRASMRATPIRAMSAVTQNVPEMGDSITEGTIAGWSKAVGEYCELDEVHLRSKC